MQRFEFDSVDSTNDAAKRLVAEGRVRGRALVVAREQTAGKGTRGRTWLSPLDAGLYMSVVEVCTDRPRMPATDYTLAAGVACVEALAKCAGVRASLKPINDLCVNGRKLGGILVETSVQNGGVTSLVTGVGINTHRAERRLPDHGVPAVCLEELLPAAAFARLDREALIDDLGARLFSWNEKVAAGASELVRDAWERHKLPGTSVRQ